jgi:hypothetical protein
MAPTRGSRSRLPLPYPSAVTLRQYRLALLDASGEPIPGAQFVHVSGETPMPGLRIDLPNGTWFVHEVTATYSERSSRLLHADDYGGTLICRPEPPNAGT